MIKTKISVNKVNYGVSMCPRITQIISSNEISKIFSVGIRSAERSIKITTYHKCITINKCSNMK